MSTQSCQKIVGSEKIEVRLRQPLQCPRPFTSLLARWGDRLNDTCLDRLRNVLGSDSADSYNRVCRRVSNAVALGIDILKESDCVLGVDVP